MSAANLTRSHIDVLFVVTSQLISHIDSALGMAELSIISVDTAVFMTFFDTKNVFCRINSPRY